jgi:peptidoglycan/LPS O-acetylase OafA/YrhL
VAKSSYLPGLDGLRALSVIAVLIYHARPEWLPGGYLGVEVFFVISGFIITRALLSEWRESGRIRLGSFWQRRARRLLPAVGLLLAVVVAYVAAFKPDELTKLREDALSAILYVTNWHLILGNQSYFDSFQRPSMLKHLWSLAVEEQFYIVWPMLLAFGLPILKQKGLAVLIIAGIAASAIAMALLYDPTGDSSRAYYGTDTRAAGLLVGALMAFIMAANQGRDFGPWGRRGAALLGAILLGLLGYATFWLSDSKAFLYQGGFLSVSVLSSVLILVATQRNLITDLLSLKPLRWVGIRSYGIYLWHWPIYMLVWPRESTLTEFALQVLATVTIAAASYSLLETPIRQGALGRAWQGFCHWSAQSWRYRGALVFSGSGTMAIVVSLVAVSVMAKPPELPAYFQTGSIQIHSVVAQDVGSVVRGPTLLGRVQTTISALTTDERSCPSDNLSPGGQTIGIASTPFGSTCPQPPALFAKPEAAAEAEANNMAQTPPADQADGQNVSHIEPPTSGETPATETTPEPTQEAPSQPETPAATPETPPADVSQLQPPVTVRVTAIGDSVMQGAAYALSDDIPNIDLDAAVGRQAAAAVDLLSEKAAAGALGDIVVIHIGNNGTLTSSQFDQIMAVIGHNRKAIFLNLHVPRTWQDSNNAVITNGVASYPNAVLIDWNTVANTYPGILYNDGIHLMPDGAAYYAQLVTAAIAN